MESRALVVFLALGQAAFGQTRTPSITNVTNASSAAGPVSLTASVALAPGSLAAIFGANLADSTASAAAPGQPLLGGIEVHLAPDSCQVASCELTARLMYVSPARIDFVVPGVNDITKVLKTSVAIVKNGQRVATSSKDVYVDAVYLESQPSPALYDQPVTFTAHVSAMQGTPGSPFSYNVGAVTFMDGETALGVVGLSNLITYTDNPPFRRYDVSFTTSKLAAGTHSIRADYSGDYYNSPASSSVITQVVGVPEITISSTPNPSRSGQTVTLIATFSPASCTGTVTFFDPILQLGTATIDKGRALLSTAALTIGNHPITVNYSGDNRCAPLAYGPANDYYYRTTSQTVLCCGN